MVTQKTKYLPLKMIQRLICNQCGKDFASPQALSNHQRIKGRCKPENHFENMNKRKATNQKMRGVTNSQDELLEDFSLSRDNDIDVAAVKISQGYFTSSKNKEWIKRALAENQISQDDLLPLKRVLKRMEQTRNEAKPRLMRENASIVEQFSSVASPSNSASASSASSSLSVSAIQIFHNSVRNATKERLEVTQEELREEAKRHCATYADETNEAEEEYQAAVAVALAVMKEKRDTAEKKRDEALKLVNGKATIALNTINLLDPACNYYKEVIALLNGVIVEDT